MKRLLRLGFSAPTDFRCAARSFVSTRNLPQNNTRNYSTPTFDDADMGKEKDGKTSYQLKVPKGTKDWDGKDMVIREKIFGTITEVFKRHGAVTIDTSVNSVSAIAMALTDPKLVPCSN